MKTLGWICVLGLLIISMMVLNSYYSANNNYHEELQNYLIVEDEQLEEALINIQREKLEYEDYEVYEEEKCDYGYSDEYKCDGNKIKREWVRSNCSSRWFYFDWCNYGCYDGECLKLESKPVDDVKDTIPEEALEDKSNLPICSYNTYNCGDFENQVEAQSVMEYCEAITGKMDIHWLDGDDDGVACELNNNWDYGESHLNFGLLGKRW